MSEEEEQRKFFGTEPRFVPSSWKVLYDLSKVTRPLQLEDLTKRLSDAGNKSKPSQFVWSTKYNRYELCRISLENYMKRMGSSLEDHIKCREELISSEIAPYFKVLLEIDAREEPFAEPGSTAEKNEITRLLKDAGSKMEPKMIEWARHGKWGNLMYLCKAGTCHKTLVNKVKSCTSENAKEAAKNSAEDRRTYRVYRAVGIEAPPGTTLDDVLVYLKDTIKPKHIYDGVNNGTSQDGVRPGHRYDVISPLFQFYNKKEGRMIVQLPTIFFDSPEEARKFESYRIINLLAFAETNQEYVVLNKVYGERISSDFVLQAIGLGQIGSEAFNFEEKAPKPESVYDLEFPCKSEDIKDLTPQFEKNKNIAKLLTLKPVSRGKKNHFYVYLMVSLYPHQAIGLDVKEIRKKLQDPEFFRLYYVGLTASKTNNPQYRRFHNSGELSPLRKFAERGGRLFEAKVIVCTDAQEMQLLESSIIFHAFAAEDDNQCFKSMNTSYGAILPSYRVQYAIQSAQIGIPMIEFSNDSDETTDKFDFPIRSSESDFREVTHFFKPRRTTI